MNTHSYDIVVIGAGAAGMMAAGEAASHGAKVLLLEKMERPGRKLLITGKEDATSQILLSSGILSHTSSQTKTI